MFSLRNKKNCIIIILKTPFYPELCCVNFINVHVEVHTDAKSIKQAGNDRGFIGQVGLYISRL